MKNPKGLIVSHMFNSALIPEDDEELEINRLSGDFEPSNRPTA